MLWPIRFHLSERVSELLIHILFIHLIIFERIVVVVVVFFINTFKHANAKKNASKNIYNVRKEFYFELMLFF